MELRLNTENFLSDFTKVRNIGNRKAKERSEGFMYLHESTTKRLALGDGFEMSDIDFTKFTNDDLKEYMHYYQSTLEPKITMIKNCFCLANTVFALFIKLNKFFIIVIFGSNVD